MPSLDWIGKEAVREHHKDVPFHLLRCDPDLSVGDPGTGNLLIQGDNLLALKSLLPYYNGKVKCIYIDPPYNTGEELWVYNDNVNNPEIKTWLGEVVGKEFEDLTRHDKWLCMMYPRLVLLKKFLRNDGVIFVSIGENEAGNLRLLLDEIFDISNALGTLVWKRRSSSAMRGTPLSIDHEYILVYAKDVSKATLYGIPQEEDTYPFEDDRGRYASTDLTVGMDKDARPGQFYPIRNPRTGIVFDPNPERVWRFFPATMEKVIDADLIIWPDEHPGNMTRPRYKTYYDPENTRPKPLSSWIETSSVDENVIIGEEIEHDIHILQTGMNQEGGRLIQQIFGSKVFAYPKPLSLLRSLVKSATRNNDVILDSFAGTGTTAHAVMDINKEDDGSRRYILVEMESEISQNITAQRLKKIVEGYTWEGQRGKVNVINGLGGGFRYCTLDEPLFDLNGSIQPSVTYEELAIHIFFSETGEPLSGNYQGDGPLLGYYDSRAIYLLFNGILGDLSESGGNVLTRQVLANLPPYDGPKVIYGEGCLLSQTYLQSHNIVFRQLPYEIKVN